MTKDQEQDRLMAHELWVQTPHVFILDNKISDAAFRLGCLLAKYAGRNGCAFPKQQRLAKDLNWSLRTVSRRITELRESGWLRTERRWAGGPCNYYLATPEEMGYARCGVGVTPKVAQQEGDSKNLLPSEGPHASRTAPRRASRRAEEKRRAAEEDAYDPAKSMGLWDDEKAAQEPQEQPRGGWGADRRQKVTGRRQPGPDTGPGLARHWRETVEEQPWAFGLESNLRALASHFVKLKGAGLTPDELREMSALYATTEGLRNPRALAWQDFIGKRALLIDAIRKGREVEALKEHPDAVYQGWDGPSGDQPAGDWAW
ncbi:helix-turn-helix domain-containing protein [Streptomyces sp. RTd22]|uniref:helix-turn-helix domain-containing protein n=1 Tax=Streptomyces sp. RTd22 TaxID=1841249 RepID=UPI0007C49A76|nr:helix-turn-helix domain-containing protein [Streptomyces sp. RTd22]